MAFIAAMAFGLIRPDGREPALNAWTLPSPRSRANASAIWLRLEFSTQTKRMVFTTSFPQLFATRTRDAASTLNYLFHETKTLIEERPHTQVNEPIIDANALTSRFHNAQIRQ